MRGIPAISLLVLLASSCPAATLCVNPSAPGPAHDGTSWASAYATVKAALASASPGDEVWVTAGTYKENITLPSGVALYGGFLGAETSREQRDPVKNATVLDAQSNGTVVTIPPDATSATILDGFTLQNGYGPLDTTGYGGAGGGIFVGGGTPVISNNTIQNCVAGAYRTIPSYGGGIYVKSGMPMIAGNTITHCGAVYGGGIYAVSGLIRDNLFVSNSAGPGYYNNGNGGGLALGAAGVAVHNTFLWNRGEGDGGAGLYCSGGTVIGNTFTDNIGDYGAAMQCTYNCTVLRNVVTDSRTNYYVSDEIEFDGGTFADNVLICLPGEGLGLGWGQGNSDGSQPVIANNTFIQIGQPTATAIWSLYYNGERPMLSNNLMVGWANAGRTYNRSFGTPPTFTVDHNDSYGNGDNVLNLPGASPIDQNGNISQDPLFVNPSAGDYHLQVGSPCIDAGNDAAVKPLDRDFDGAPRIAGAHVDIGAYEAGSPLYTVQDAATVLRIAAGISLSTPADLSRLDVAGETGLTVTDATRIAQWLLN